MDFKFWQNNFSQTSLFKMWNGKKKKPTNSNQHTHTKKQGNQEINQSFAFRTILKQNRTKHEAEVLRNSGFKTTIKRQMKRKFLLTKVEVWI